MAFETRHQGVFANEQGDVRLLGLPAWLLEPSFDSPALTFPEGEPLSEARFQRATATLLGGTSVAAVLCGPLGRTARADADRSTRPPEKSTKGSAGRAAAPPQPTPAAGPDAYGRTSSAWPTP